MDNIKLGYIHVPIHSYLPSRNTTNTVQETREMTEEEKNVTKGFAIITSIILIIFTIYVAISIHKISKI